MKCQYETQISRSIYAIKTYSISNTLLYEYEYEEFIIQSFLQLNLFDENVETNQMIQY